MVATSYTNTRETPTPLSSPSLKDTEEALFAGVTVPNETSALLPDDRRVHVSQRSLTERGQSAISSFLDKNTGLLFVASSQFFFAASNLCVEWLNSLDESERVPVLEVRDIFWVVIDLQADDFKCKVDMGSDGEYISTYSPHSPI
jgi:hypothetical protein